MLYRNLDISAGMVKMMTEGRLEVSRHGSCRRSALELCLLLHLAG